MTTVRRRTAGKSGFTLIELLIVFVIMSLLTGLGIGAFMTSRVRARDAKRKSDLENITRALELYYNDLGVYPPEVTGTILGLQWGTGKFILGSGADEVIYMNELPKDPGPSTYLYKSTGGSNFLIFARLENTDDDAVKKSASGVPLRYTDYLCGSEKCNYYLASSNYTSDPATEDDP